MRIGTLCPLNQPDTMHELVASGFQFIEITATQNFTTLPNDLPNVPTIWQCPVDLPADHSAKAIREAVLTTWREHLQAAQQIGSNLMVVQFRRPDQLENKTALIEHYASLLQPISDEARAAGVQLVLRNSPDNRDQLQLLREIVRRVDHLAIALDLAYTQQRVIKNLMKEYLWDTDLSIRIAHVYASDTNGQDANLRLPLGCLGSAGIDWARLVRELRERYNASVTIDVGHAPLEYLDLSRENWLTWWQID